MLNNIAYEMKIVVIKKSEFKVIQNMKFSLNREINMSRKFHVIIR